MTTMFTMFESATLKLTTWYLLIIMVISILFSVLIYQSASSEVGTRLEQFGQEIAQPLSGTSLTSWPGLRQAQLTQATHNLLISLIYINCLIFVAGGIASYLMAKRTLKPLEEAHEAESRFVSNASHELRTPLAAMKTELEVALRDPKTSKDEMRELLGSNLEEVDKLTRLSQTLLSLSRLHYDRLTHEPVQFNQLVSETVKHYDTTGKRISLRQTGRPVIIDAHRSSIEELLVILIDNALKYSPPESLVQITVGRRERKALFEISNPGPGIDAKDLPHIFDRFYRADNSRTATEKTSFGLGLSLAKTIVELHHGELSASSALGGVTTFVVLLPLVDKSLLNRKMSSKKA